MQAAVRTHLHPLGKGLACTLGAVPTRPGPEPELTTASQQPFGCRSYSPLEGRPAKAGTRDGFIADSLVGIKTGKPARSNFPDYAGPLTETILLGNLAVWVAADGGLGEKVEWDARYLKVKNISGLEGIVKPEYREGYTL